MRYFDLPSPPIYLDDLRRSWTLVNPLTPNDTYRGRTAPLTSKRCILYIYSTNIGTEYFKHGIYSPFLSLQNAVCFIILMYLVPVLFTFYIQDVLKLKKNNSGAKRLKCECIQESTAETTVSFGAIRYRIDSQLTEQHRRQIKPVQVKSTEQKTLRMGKNKKGVINRIINYIYRNTNAPKPVNN